MMKKAKVEKLLKSYIEPHLQTDLFSAKAVKHLQINDQVIELELEFGFPINSIADTLRTTITQLLNQAFPEAEIKIALNSKIVSHAVQTGVKANPRIKNIIVVGSGKGGVGKSTTAVNLAIALQQSGARVGLLDADIYGPNQPQMLGGKEKPEITGEKKFIPVEKYGLQTHSLGYLVDDDQAMIWRGPMVSGALLQLLNDTEWQELDYLVIDLPPGTGDIQLTLAKQIPVSGAVIVTTPQSVSVADAAKGLAMFKRVAVPLLGVVENMSYYLCPCCDTKAYLFGQGGGKSLAEKHQLPLLAEIPLNQQIREQADVGEPIILAEPNSQLAEVYKELALNTAAQLALRPKNHMRNFPDVVVENR